MSLVLITADGTHKARCADCGRLHVLTACQLEISDQPGFYLCDPCNKSITDRFRWLNDVPDKRRKRVRVMCYHCETMYELTPDERQRALDGRDLIPECPDCRPRRTGTGPR